MPSPNPPPRPDFLHSFPSLLDLASTPQLNVEIAESPQKPDLAVNDNLRYKAGLRYLPNDGFSGVASLPNTFQHKSHPNAKAKPQIGPLLAEEPSCLADFSALPKPMTHSTVRGLNAGLSPGENALHPDAATGSLDTSAPHTTPSWMPLASEERWDSGLQNAPLQLEFLQPHELGTFVHKPRAPDQLPETPMWKKLSDQYQHNMDPSNSPLRKLFLGPDSSKEFHTNPKAYALLSTISTPVATKESDIHLTQQQIHQLESMLEEAKDKPDDFHIKGSPLKLFGNDYDTFTKAILSKFVEKVRSNANSIQREAPSRPQPQQLSLPKLKIKNFTKSGDYTDVDFMKNANNIFANLQKGYKPDSGLEHRLDQPSHKSVLTAQTLDTATSTPKIDRAKNLDDIASIEAYSLYSTDTNTLPGSHELHAITDRAEYTEIEKSYLTKKVSDVSLAYEDEDGSSYTFDEVSEYLTNFETDSTKQGSQKNKNAESDIREVSPSPHLELVHEDFALPLLENSFSSVKQFLRDQKKRSVSEKKLSLSSSPFEQPPNPIKWKRLSKLNLSENVNRPQNSLAKGFVKAGSFPDRYGNMIFDADGKKWISSNKENEFGGSLDSIESLVIEEQPNSIPRNRDTSILKKRGKSIPKKADRKFEVSFQMPNTSTSTVDRQAGNVTNVSDFQNVTFSQTNKELVSLITGSTDEVAWESITAIDMSDKNIERVENLEEYLPAVRTVNLSNNKLKFIDGLPSCLSDLNVTRNGLGNITSFRKFHDLHVLNASFNDLESPIGLSHNVNLTELNLTGNRIKSLRGLQSLSGLVTLKLSRNRLSGSLNLLDFDLHSLKELDISENRIQALNGLEALENLRVLNVNENRLTTLGCSFRHVSMKKLLCKSNELTSLDVEKFPFLRVLRIDGNRFDNIDGFHKLKYLQEVSLKCQKNSSVIRQIVSSADKLSAIDFSGNVDLLDLVPSPGTNLFSNLNNLNLSAVGLQKLPEDFGTTFCNVRILNLNFNRLNDLLGMSKLEQLKKVMLLSNNIANMKGLLMSLQKSRRTLKSLDLRLNILNTKYYPYVFSPDELDFAQDRVFDSESPIPLQALDDIENFAIHYNALVKEKDEWQERDSEYICQMQMQNNSVWAEDRQSYEAILQNFFPNLRDLDGGYVNRGRP